MWEPKFVNSSRNPDRINHFAYSFISKCNENCSIKFIKMANSNRISTRDRASDSWWHCRLLFLTFPGDSRPISKQFDHLWNLFSIGRFFAKSHGSPDCCVINDYLPFWSKNPRISSFCSTGAGFWSLCSILNYTVMTIC